jgi:hypothetical protein
VSAGADPRVIDAISNAYYTRAVTAADLARSRAQNGFAVASFIAGGLVGAGLLSRIASVPVSTRIIGAFALIAWVVGATLYARAVAEPVALETGTQENPEDFVAKVLENAKAERDQVDLRRRAAQWASLVAAALTTVAVVLGFLLTPSAAVKTASIVLTAQGTVAFRILCGVETNLVHGQLNVASLGSQFIIIKPTRPGCSGRELHLSHSEIIEITTSD